MFGPATLRAQPGRFVPTFARNPEHQRVLELLSGLFIQCHAVIRVHQRMSSPFVEALLWMHDRENHGLVDPDEIGLLSHSEVSHTISFRTLRPHDRQPAKDARLLSWGGEMSWDPAQLEDPEFCTWWRRCDLVESRTIGRGISDLQLAWIDAVNAGPSGLEIALTWSADSSDSSDQASTLVAVHPRIPGVLE